MERNRYAAPPMDRIRVGFIGIGERGTTAVFRVSGIPGTETAAMADLRPVQCENAKKWLEEKGRPGAKRIYAGAEESWKALCDDPDVDVVYVTAPATDPSERDYVARAFWPKIGIPEDPVCGSMQSALVPYWSERLGKRELVCRQTSARGGTVWCEDTGGAVLISGTGSLYLQGHIL